MLCCAELRRVAAEASGVSGQAAAGRREGEKKRKRVTCVLTNGSPYDKSVITGVETVEGRKPNGLQSSETISVQFLS